MSHEIERGLIFATDGPLDFAHIAKGTDYKTHNLQDGLLNPGWTLPDEGFKLDESLKALEADLIKRALERAEGNLSAAARLLGVQRDYLRYRLKD